MRTLLPSMMLIVTLASCGPAPGQNESPAASQDPSSTTIADADRALRQALDAGDTAAALALMDDAVTWTDAAGRTVAKDALAQGLPAPIIMNETDAEAQTSDYDRVAVIRAARGRLHTLRVWVQRAAGWRLLVYQEIESLASAPAPAPGIDRECVNPCKEVPYEPKTDNERAVIAAFQALEVASHAADVANWGRYVADEFVMVSSNSDRVIDKATRIEGLRKAAYGGVSPSPLLSAEFFDFGTAVVMRAAHQPVEGNPLQVARVWVNRNDQWMSVVSYQTVVRSPQTAAR